MPEGDGRVGPPETEGGVEREPGEHAGGEVCAEHVLGAFAGGGAGAEPRADRCLARPSAGMTRMLEMESPIPIQLVPG